MNVPVVYKYHMGKVYANWCPHCVSLEPKWNYMKNYFQNNNNNDKDVNFIEIEQSQMEDEIPKINNSILANSTEKLSADKGFPTIFFVDGDKLEYYEGPRETENMIQWVSSKMHKMRKPRKTKKTKRTKKMMKKRKNRKTNRNRLSK
jgi:thiol-disulfide isomerase/thioredoxin